MRSSDGKLLVGRGSGHNYDIMVVGGRREMEVTEIPDILNCVTSAIQ